VEEGRLATDCRVENSFKLWQQRSDWLRDIVQHPISHFEVDSRPDQLMT